MKNSDLRAELPEAKKSGTAHRPVWTIKNKQHRFVTPVKKDGTNAKGRKVRIGGKRLFAKYVAGHTINKKPLLFVGVFEPVVS
jgi:hypothetical protein